MTIDQSTPNEANTFLLCDQNYFVGPCSHPAQNQVEGDHIEVEQQPQGASIEQQPPLEEELNQEEGDHIEVEQQAKDAFIEQQPPLVEEELSQALIRSNRLRNPPPYLKDYVSLAAQSPKQYSEPKTLKSAFKDPLWVNAMQEEISALHSNQTWVLVPRPTNANVVGIKIGLSHQIQRRCLHRPFQGKVSCKGLYSNS